MIFQDVVILCFNRKHARECFEAFCRFMESRFPFEIVKIYDESNGLLTVEDYRYIFLEEPMAIILNRSGKADEVYFDHFFRYLDECYEEEFFKDFYIYQERRNKVCRQ